MTEPDLDFDLPDHLCPATRGAHAFQVDASGIVMCECGEVDVQDISDETAGDLPLPRLPEDRARELYERVAEVLERQEPGQITGEHGSVQAWVDHCIANADVA